MIKGKQWNQISVLELTHDQPQSARKSRFSLWTPIKVEYFPTRIITTQYNKDSRFIISPENKFIMCWDIITILIIVFQSFYIPFILAFELTDDSTWFILDTLTTFYFLIDIFLTLNIGIYEDGSLVEDREEIFKNYKKQWLLIDCVSLLPYFLFPLPSYKGYNYSWIKSSRILRLLMLARISKLNDLLFKLQERLDNKLISSIFMVAQIMSTEIFIAHLLACSFYAIGNYEAQFYPNVWITTAYLESYSVLELYVTALYWSVTTMATVGYGDIKPDTPAEIGFVTVSMISSCIVIGYVIGAIQGIVMSYTSRENQRKEMLAGINDFMLRREIPAELIIKVRRYLDYVLEIHRKNEVEESEVLENMSKELRELVFIYSRGFIFNNCHGFSKINPKVLKKTTLIIAATCYAQNDVIFKEGEKSRDLYYIHEGSVVLEDCSSGCFIKRLEKLGNFGEIEFFLGTARLCSARSVSFLQTLTIKYNAFNEILNSEPETKEYLEQLERKNPQEALYELGIDCFICKKRGHVAKNCEIFNYGKKESIAQLLEMKKGPKSVKIKEKIPEKNIPPRFLRFKPRDEVIYLTKKNQRSMYEKNSKKDFRDSNDLEFMSSFNERLRFE